MADKYSWSILVYLVSSLLCSYAATNASMSRSDSGGFKNDSLLENDPELNYVPSGPLVLCSFL